MKWLKRFNEINEKLNPFDLENTFVNLFYDLIDICVEDIDKHSDKYKREDIKLFTSLLLGDVGFEYLVYYLSGNEKDDINKSDIIYIDEIKDINDTITIEFALSYNNSFLSANYGDIIKRIERLYPDFKFETMDPYSFDN
jgi:hypothetical protein